MLLKLKIKGTICVVLNDLPCKYCNARFTLVSLKALSWLNINQISVFIILLTDYFIFRFHNKCDLRFQENVEIKHLVKRQYLLQY